MWCLSFLEVFPTDLPGMPPYRHINFCIDLETDTLSISISPYCMAPAELREITVQIQELLDKGSFVLVFSSGVPLSHFLRKRV